MAHSQLMAEMVTSSGWEANASNTVSKKEPKRTVKQRETQRKPWQQQCKMKGNKNGNEFKFRSMYLWKSSLEQCILDFLLEICNFWCSTGPLTHGSTQLLRLRRLLWGRWKGMLLPWAERKGVNSMWCFLPCMINHCCFPVIDSFVVSALLTSVFVVCPDCTLGLCLHF